MGRGPDEAEEKEKEDDFNKCGPRHLKDVNWGVLEQRKSVVASLVNGVYVHEQDRQKERTNQEALGPNWWESFHFQLIKNLTDEYDDSIFGAIFEYKHPDLKHNHDKLHEDKKSQCGPPKYVVAIRGTSLKWHNALRDIFYDGKYFLNIATKSTRYQISLQEVRDLIDKVGQQNVWLAGHSLGAAIALQVGKTMAREGCQIDAYLFNPPFLSVPIKMLKDSPLLKFGLRFGKDIVAAGLYLALKDSDNGTSIQHYDQFAAIRTWVPYLFVNKNDPACSEYIGHFKYRKRIGYVGLGWLTKIASPNSVKSLVFGALGSDTDPVHLIPSAQIVNNMYPNYDETLCHKLSQWWEPNTQCGSERYILK